MHKDSIRTNCTPKATTITHLTSLNTYQSKLLSRPKAKYRILLNIHNTTNCSCVVTDSERKGKKTTDSLCNQVN